MVHTASLICKGRSTSDGKHQTEHFLWSVSYAVHFCRSCACPLVQAICPNRFASKPDRHRNGITNDKMQAPKNKMFSTLTRSERLITIRLKFRSPFVCSVHFSSHMYVRLGKRETESDPVRCCVSVSMLFFHPISVRPYLGTRVSTVRYLAHARALFTPRLHSPAPSWHDAERREWSIVPAIDNFRCKAVFLQTVQSAHRPHYSNGYTVKGAQSHTHTHGRNPTHTHTLAVRADTRIPCKQNALQPYAIRDATAMPRKRLISAPEMDR